MTFDLWQPLLLTLSGVVVGAVSASIGQALTDRRKWQRERDVRWDVRRMETYAAYGNAVKKVTMMATRVAAQRGLGEALEPISIDDGLVQLAEAQVVRGALWEEMLLLADPATITAARGWHETSWAVSEFAYGTRSGQEEWQAAMVRVNDARAEFHRAARADLGVAGIPPATTFPRQARRESDPAEGDRVNL